MIREELFHPLLVHFPITILFLALCLKLVTYLPVEFVKENMKSLCFAQRACLYFGPILFMMTMYLGDSAFEIVRPKLENLLPVYKHEQLAYEALYFFMAALFFEILSTLDKIEQKVRRVLSVMSFVFLVGGNYLMFESAHIGAMLVYKNWP